MIKSIKRNWNYRFILAIICSIAFYITLVWLPDTVQASSSPYLVKINKQQNCVTIYEKDEEGEYTVPIKSIVCSTGVATPLGTFTMGGQLRWHILDGPVYGQYCRRITGHILFHSVWYYGENNPATLSSQQYNRLGQAASHGCVRLAVADAKWIYDNCPTGTKIIIYNAKKPGPLGKPEAIQLPAGTGWDPTDVTNPKNPFNKKKPSIKVKDETIIFAADFDILEGVTAKNTTGFDAIKRVVYTIKYKLKGTSSYKKVKKIETTKPGVYKVSYKLVDEINRTAKETATYRVLTKVAIKSFTLNKNAKTLYLGGTSKQKFCQLSMKNILPKSASIQQALYTSSDPSVVYVDEKGKVKAVGVGTADVTALAKDGSGITAVCSFKVKRYAKSVTLSTANTVVPVSGSVSLIPTVSPASTTDKQLIYVSSDISVATVDTNGVVYGLKPGNVTITATTNDGTRLQASIALTVAYLYQTLTENTIADVTVSIGTPAEAVMATLPTQLSIRDAYGNVSLTNMIWTLPAYNSSTVGTYQAIGTMTLPQGWTGTPQVVTVNVIVN